MDWRNPPNDLIDALYGKANWFQWLPMTRVGLQKTAAKVEGKKLSEK